MSKSKTLSDEEIVFFIKKGIENAKGSSELIFFLTEDDCQKLGEQLANREAFKNTTFFSVVVDPINNIEEGKKIGHYDSIYDHISQKTIPLQKAIGAKRIYFVPVNERVEEGRETEFLAKFGKRPVTNAPNYLLGAMAKLEEKDLPENLKLKDFVAVSSDEKEAFSDRGGYPCFLACNRSDGGRELLMVKLVYEWHLNHGWVFLAEDPL
jgi:hypothetical protein